MSSRLKFEVRAFHSLSKAGDCNGV